MNKYLQTDPWCIMEVGFHANKQLASESVFSLGNGSILQRANFEEYYSGETILGSCIIGIDYPEFTKQENLGNKHPETNDININAPNWTEIDVRLNNEQLDLAKWDVQNFRRVLNMREGFLERTFDAISEKGYKIQVSAKRFLSMAETEVGVISYSLKSLNYEGRISFSPVIDGNIKTQQKSQNKQTWSILQTKTQQGVSHVWAKTMGVDFHMCAAFTYVLYKNNELLKINPTKIEKEKIAGFCVGVDVRIGDTVCLNKYVAITNSLNYTREELTERACNLATTAKKKGWNQLFEEHTAVWKKKWSEYKTIDGDLKTQQTKRYNIFQQNQTKRQSL